MYEDYVKANTFGYILIQYKSGGNVYRAMYVPLKNRPIPSSEYAPYLSHDMFGINFDSFFKHCTVYYESFTCFGVGARCFPDCAKLPIQ